MRTKLVRLFALLFAFTLIAAACGSDEPTAVADEPASEATDDEATDDSESAPGTIVDVAVGAGDFTTLVAAVQAAGLVDTLSGEGPFTVFAPTDAAFEAALADLGVTAEELLANPDLGDILTYHVVPGAVPASDVVTLDGQEVATVNGATVAISIDGENVMVNNANVITTDIIASNGIIHVIDAVLLPPPDRQIPPANVAFTSGWAPRCAFSLRRPRADRTPTPERPPRSRRFGPWRLRR